MQKSRPFSKLSVEAAQERWANLISLVRIGDVNSLLQEIMRPGSLLTDRSAFDEVVKLTLDEFDENGFYDSMYAYAVFLIERDLLTDDQVHHVMDLLIRSCNLKLTCDFVAVMTKKNLVPLDEHVYRISKFKVFDSRTRRVDPPKVAEGQNAVEQLMRILVLMTEQRIRPRLRWFHFPLDVLGSIVPDSTWRTERVLQVVDLAEVTLNKGLLKDVLQIALGACGSDMAARINVLERMKRLAIYCEEELVNAYAQAGDLEAAMNELNEMVDRERDVNINVYLHLFRLLHANGRLDLCDKLVLQRIRQRKGSYSVWQELMWLWVGVGEMERAQAVLLDIVGSGFNINYLHCVIVLHKYVLSPKFHRPLEGAERVSIPDADTFEPFAGERISVGGVLKRVDFRKLLDHLDSEGLLANNLMVAYSAYTLSITRIHDKDLIAHVDKLLDQHMDSMVAATNAILASDTRRMCGYTRLAEIYRPYEPFAMQPDRSEKVKQTATKTWLHKMINIHKKKTYEVADLPDYALQHLWLSMLSDMKYRIGMVISSPVYERRFNSKTLSAILYYKMFKPYEFLKVRDESENEHNNIRSTIDKHFRMRLNFKNLLSPHIAHQNLVLNCYLKVGDIVHLVHSYKNIKSMPNCLIPNSETYQPLITAYSDLRAQRLGIKEYRDAHYTTTTHAASPPMNTSSSTARNKELQVPLEELELYMLDEAENACARYYATSTAAALHRKLVEGPEMQSKSPEEVRELEQRYRRETAVVNMAASKLWFASQDILLNHITAKHEQLLHIFGETGTESAESSRANLGVVESASGPQSKSQQVEVILQSIDALVARFLKTLAVQDEMGHVLPNDQTTRMAVLSLTMHEGQYTSDDRYLQTAAFMVTKLAKSRRYHYESVRRLIHYLGSPSEHALEPYTESALESFDAIAVEVIPRFSLPGIDFADVVETWSGAKELAGTSDVLRNRDELMAELWGAVSPSIMRHVTDKANFQSLMRSFLRSGRDDLVFELAVLYCSARDVVSHSIISDFESLWGALLFASRDVQPDGQTELPGAVTREKMIETMEVCLLSASQQRFLTHPAYLLTLLRCLNAVQNEEIRIASLVLATRLACEDLTRLVDSRLWKKIKVADPEFESNVESISTILTELESEFAEHASRGSESDDFSFSFSQHLETISALRSRINDLSSHLDQTDMLSMKSG